MNSVPVLIVALFHAGFGMPRAGEDGCFHKLVAPAIGGTASEAEALVDAVDDPVAQVAFLAPDATLAHNVVQAPAAEATGGGEGGHRRRRPSSSSFS